MVNKIWIDFTNTPHVHFLMAIKRMLSDNDFEYIYSIRDFSETKKLLEKYIASKDYLTINPGYGRSKASKAFSLLSRFNMIRKADLKYDLSLSCGSEGAIWHSKLKGKKSIAFGDNDTAKQWTYGYFVNYSFFPDAIAKSVLEKQGLKGKLYQYRGFKEDIYISYYKPDIDFKKSVPFDNYVVVRPENIHANYLKKANVKSIVPQLLAGLSKRGYNIVYLPRYPQDRVFSKGIKNIHVPEIPLNGLDLCYYSDGVLTGAGTFAREAACLGIPSFSFYAGNTLLAVDNKLISEKKVFYSRDPSSIIQSILKSNKHTPDFQRSIDVREEVKAVLLEKLQSWI